MIQRLRKLGIPTQKQVVSFFQLYQGRLTPEVGRVLKDLFSEEELYRYFRGFMMPAQERTATFEQTLRDYFLLELSPVDLLRILAQDALGPRLPLKEILSKLFACRVHIPLSQKNCVDPLGLDAAIGGDEEKHMISRHSWAGCFLP